MVALNKGKVTIYTKIYEIQSHHSLVITTKYMFTRFSIKLNSCPKTKLLIFGFIKHGIAYAAHNLRSKRCINIFTGRCVRFAKQVIYKKTGKVSSHQW